MTPSRAQVPPAYDLAPRDSFMRVGPGRASSITLLQESGLSISRHGFPIRTVPSPEPDREQGRAGANDDPYLEDPGDRLSLPEGKEDDEHRRGAEEGPSQCHEELPGDAPTLSPQQPETQHR